METLKDSAIVIGRIVTIVPLLLFVTIFMGKRAIGELPIFDFLIILTLGAVVGADIADPSISHFPTAVAIVALGIFQRVIASWKISNRKLGRMITFEPTVVVKDGKILDENLRRIRYSIDNVLQMLRQKDVFDLNDVDTAIIEANGELSVFKMSHKNTVTLEDMGISKNTASLALPVIMEGTIYHDVLNQYNLNQTWLNQQLEMRNVKSINDVLFASVNNKLEFHISLKNEKVLNIPKVYH
ncbi:DUF421 domain-containing protein [Aquibacillus halophilus]|uniref:DUF421 domain-containing protein n=1 Tax=Aquibacillus halophilus TaxID=930132 RepID=A0A6A8DF31_9BACI|nr:DUF421 domain-containing protein [Aquibacillus halophilus]